MKRIALAAPIVLFMTVGHAASFDCSKAGTRIEHLICDSPEISKLDDELAASYKDALHNSGNGDAIKREQRQWVDSVE